MLVVTWIGRAKQSHKNKKYTGEQAGDFKRAKSDKAVVTGSENT